MIKSSRMSIIMVPVDWNDLELGKIAEFNFVYNLASTDINQSAPNFVKIYMTIRSWILSIMSLIELKQHEIFALQLELLYLTWFALSHLHAYLMQTDKSLFKPKRHMILFEFSVFIIS